MSEGSSRRRSAKRQRRSSSSSPNPSTRSGEEILQEERPDFFDAAGVVAPGIFGARRLIETKALYQESCPCISNNNIISSNSTQCYQSGGSKTSSRHLRRRTTSYNTRKWHRYPTGFAATPSSSVQHGSANKRTSRRSRRKNQAALRSSHESWRRRQWHGDVVEKDEEGSIEIEEMRHEEGKDDNVLAVDPKQREASVVVTGASALAIVGNNSIHWMTTHVWHAKRFHMHPSHCGWKVPLLHNNRGAKAALRLARDDTKCLVQDVTWRMQPLVLEINNDAATTTTAESLAKLQRALSRVIVPPINLAIERDDNENAVRMEKGMLHHANEFPSGALGPVTWMFRKTTLLAPHAPGEKSDNKSMYLYLWLHPSIRQSACAALTAAIDSERPLQINLVVKGPHGSVVRSEGGGLSYIQVRGKNTLPCLVKALESLSSTNAPFDLAPLQEAASSDAIRVNEAKIISLTTSTIQGNEQQQPVKNIVLISQFPRDPSMTCNFGVCGWDVICHPSLAPALHLALVVKGGACPIGLTEEAALQLESEPPIPVFPRDYPDTEHGKTYWSTTSSSPSSSKRSTKQSTEVAVSPPLSTDKDDWKVIRTFFEGGRGRIRPQHAALVPLSWHSLVADSDDIEECGPTSIDHNHHHDKKHIVMVRGEDFGKPFVDGLIGSCVAPTENEYGKSKNRRRRRPRRPTQNPTHSVLAPLLSKKQATEHNEYLSNLVKSLSLPAVLLCHVQISNGGPGTLSSGTLIHTMDESTLEPLGFCTTGAFSQTRGRFRGLAIVGAARFLRALLSSTASTESSGGAATSTKQQHAVVLVPLFGDSQGQKRQVQLRVRALDKTIWYGASLALLL